jgi:hypothetical protein
MMKAALTLLCMTGCLASSLATLAFDAGQTSVVAAQDWPGNRTENNPVLGTTPAAVVGYNLAWAIALVVLDRELPERYRAPFHAAFTTLEVLTVWGNYRCDRGHCVNGGN